MYNDHVCIWCGFAGFVHTGRLGKAFWSWRSLTHQGLSRWELWATPRIVKKLGESQRWDEFEDEGKVGLGFKISS